MRGLTTSRSWRRCLRRSTGIAVDPHALFDVHIKRIHEYKRQLLNLLETIALYQEIRARPDADHVPRVKIFAGKAAASYDRAKLIIKLANDIAQVVNNDPVIARPAQGGVRAELQRQPRRDDHSRRRSVRADFDRRHGSLRHRQHEARAQRRASPSARWTAPISKSASMSGRRTWSSSA